MTKTFICVILLAILPTKSIAVDVNTDSYENSTRLALEHKVNTNQHLELPCFEIINKLHSTLCCFQISQYCWLEVVQHIMMEWRYSLSLDVHNYFELDGYKLSIPGWIQIPRNLSQLDDYMCGPLNRKGLVCSECADGFGPSVTSFGYTKCTNCSNAWYGVLLFLFLKFVPITVFYLFILTFKSVSLQHQCLVSLCMLNLLSSLSIIVLSMHIHKACLTRTGTSNWVWK